MSAPLFQHTRFLLLVCPLVIALLVVTKAPADPLSFSSTLTYSSSQPAPSADSIANWTGAVFDAQNVGGSGSNADGGSNNGTANDATTVVSATTAAQGQTFTTGSAANGYDLTAVTVRIAGYTNNTVSSSNYTAWNLLQANGPICVRVGKVVGTTFYLRSIQRVVCGGDGNPGSGSSANGPGTYLTFHLAYPVHLEPNTTFGFDINGYNNATNTFELLGINSDVYPGGTAYTAIVPLGGAESITPVTGDRVFQLSLTASAAAPAAFAHPGALHTAADLARMKAKVAAGAQPWTAGYSLLTNSQYAQKTWGAAPVTSIIRQGASGSNYTRSQKDAVAAYQLALRYQISGDTSYADKAVAILNAWGSTLTSVTGDSNAYLGSGICGYEFAFAAEMLSTYPGWAAADRQTFQNMMMNVFYTMNEDFLWRHNGTYLAESGNTHYRLNWDADNMASMMAIGVLCDNRAVYNQAVDYFKNGIGNGRIERAVWYIHPDGLGQAEELGRDQAHNLDGMGSLTWLCQVAWNQGDDLYSYDNYRLLRALECAAKYNLFNDVPYVYHRNSQLTYTEEVVGSGNRGQFTPIYEQIYNHYVNLLGIAAPYSQQVAAQMRPESGPPDNAVGGAVDYFGLGTLTYTLDPIASGALPSGLRADWSDHQVTLSWWGSAYATGYNVKRATVSGGPYTTIGTAGATDTTYTDANVVKGGNYYYVISAVGPSGESANSAEIAATQSLTTQYAFDGNANDSVGTKNGVVHGSAAYVTGHSGQAVSLDGASNFVQLPLGVANSQDLTIATWVYWKGGNAYQRIFDIGSEIEHCLWLTPSTGSTMRFQITTSRGNEGSATLDTGTPLPTSQWVHLAVTINSGTATIYVNGVPKVAGTFLGDPLFSQIYCYIGKSQYPADPLFNGSIDDFRIYNYALSGAAVWNLWGQSTTQPPAFATDLLTRPDATQGTNYATSGQTLAGAASDPAGRALTYLKVSGPDWLTVSASGALSGTPANADVGTVDFVMRVTNSAGATDDATLRLTVDNVNDPPTWSASTLTDPAVSPGIAYSGSLAGYASDIDVGDTLTFTKVSGPAWLTVAADGTLSGTPAASESGANSFVVRVTDASGASADATLSITVLSSGLQERYSMEGNVTDSVGGTTATLTGTPAYAAGVFGQALDFDGTTDYATLATPLSALVYKDITVAVWVNWTGGAQWQRIFDFGNSTTQYLFLTPQSGANTLRFAIKNGGAEQDVDAPASLPTGKWVHVAVTLSRNTATLYENGVAVGSSTQMTISPGDFAPTLNYLGKSQFSADPLFAGAMDEFQLYNYALSASDVAALYSSTTGLLPSAAIPFPVVNSVATASGSEGQAFNYQITATNTPTSFGASGLPTGLTVDATTGIISGTPTQSGTFNVGLSATNSGGTGTASLVLTVGTGTSVPVAELPPVVNSVLSTSANATLAFNYQITATNTPTHFGADGLPAGLTVDAASGLIAGTPTTPGVYSVTIQATNATGTGTAVLMLTITNAPLPAVVVAVPIPQVVNSTGAVGEVQLTLAAPLASDLYVTYTIKGSAINGTDYQTLTGVKKIKAGKTKANIKIVPTGDLEGRPRKW